MYLQQGRVVRNEEEGAGEEALGDQVEVLVEEMEEEEEVLVSSTVRGRQEEPV